MKTTSRRDFLKLITASAGALTAGMLAPQVLSRPLPDNRHPNILIILMDAFSGSHLSLAGYPRPTTPHIDRFAEQAHVYHNHYAPANFTTPGTASLLTGTHPWTHRALHVAGVVRKDLIPRNVFNLLGDNYHRAAFSQNNYADVLLNQFTASLDDLLPPSMFGVIDPSLGDSFVSQNDHNALRRAVNDINMTRRPFTGLPTLTLIKELIVRSQIDGVSRAQKDSYPLGLPGVGGSPIAFLNENVYDGLMDLTDAMPSPFAAYFHLFSPHDPYRPRKEFIDAFKDDRYTPVRKPNHPHFSLGVSQAVMDLRRREYDEFILNVDAEFGRLHNHLQKTGIMDTSYVILMSDHGEMFERGYYGHSTEMLYEDVIRTPLIIHAPKQTQRLDAYDATSNIDLLPTLMTIAGKPIPAWAEGRVLPGFGSQDSARTIFAMDSRTNSAFTALTSGSFAVIREGLKMIRYQYPKIGVSQELYDLKNDPEELIDLAASKPATLKDLAHELDEALAKTNAPYQRKEQ
jgi:arylsulfatase A-like enzyme